MTFFVTNNGKALLPNSKAAQIELERLPKGVPLAVDPKQRRNSRFHRLAFAFFAYVADALNDGPTAVDWDAEKVLTHIKLATGHVETVKLSARDRDRLGVEFAALPKSISFSSMDEDEFGRFMEAAFIYVRRDLCRWLEHSEHWPEIMQIMGHSVGEAA